MRLGEMIRLLAFVISLSGITFAPFEALGETPPDLGTADVRVLSVRKLVDGKPGRLVVFSRDGSRLAQVSDRRVQVADLVTGEILLDVEPPQMARAHSLAIDLSGQLVAAGYSRSGNQRPHHVTAVWEVSTGNLLATPPADGVLAFSPDAARLASIDHTGTIKIFESHTGKLIRGGRFSANNEYVQWMTHSPDGYWLVFGTSFGHLYRFSTPPFSVDGGPWPHVTPRGGPRVAFSPSGDRMVMFDTDRAVVLNARTGVALSSPLQAHHRSISSVDFSRDGQRFFTTGEDGKLGVWRADDGQLLAMSQVWPAQMFLSRTHVTPDGRFAFALGRTADDPEGQGVHVAELSMAGAAATIPNSSISQSWRILPAVLESKYLGFLAESAALHPPTGKLAIGGSGSVRMVSRDSECTTDGESMYDVEGADYARIHTIRFDRAGILVAVPGPNGLMIFNSDSCDQVAATQGGGNAFDFSPYGQLVYAQEGTLFWASSGTGMVERQKPMQLTGAAYSLAVSRTGTVAVGDQNGDVALITSNANGDRLAPIKVSASFIGALQFTPDGQLLLVGDGVGDMHVIDVGAARLLSQPKFPLVNRATTPLPPGISVSRISISADQSRVAALYGDGTFRVWELQTGEPLTVRISGAGIAGRELTFDALDRSILTTVSDKSVVMRWQVH